MHIFSNILTIIIENNHIFAFERTFFCNLPKLILANFKGFLDFIFYVKVPLFVSLLEEVFFFTVRLILFWAITLKHFSAKCFCQFSGISLFSKHRNSVTFVFLIYYFDHRNIYKPIWLC